MDALSNDASSYGRPFADSKGYRERVPAMSAKERNRQAQRAYRERQKVRKAWFFSHSMTSG